MRWSRLYALVVLYLFGVAICLLQPPAGGFQNQPIPKYEGDENPQHDGQPAFCVNEDGPWIHNCDCQSGMEHGDSCKKPDDYGPDSYDDDSKARCSTHCRRSACSCRSHCAT